MSGQPNDGGPAYPVPADQYISDGVSMQAMQSYSGMSLRDYFAGQALAGIMANRNIGDDRGPSYAYFLADAMLAEREKGGAK